MGHAPWPTADRMGTIDPRAWKHLEHMAAYGACRRSCLLGFPPALVPYYVQYIHRNTRAVEGRAVCVERKLRRGMDHGMGQQSAALGNSVFLSDLWSISRFL